MGFVLYGFWLYKYKMEALSKAGTWGFDSVRVVEDIKEVSAAAMIPARKWQFIFFDIFCIN